MAFDDHRRRSRAADSVVCGRKQSLRIPRLDQKKPAGIAAQLGKSRRVEMAAAARGIGGAQPQKRRLALAPQGEQRGKGRRGRGIERIGSKEFMDAPRRDPAAERGIETAMPGRQPAVATAVLQPAGSGDPGDAAAQPGERKGRLAHYVHYMFYWRF